MTNAPLAGLRRLAGHEPVAGRIAEHLQALVAQRERPGVGRFDEGEGLPVLILVHEDVPTDYWPIIIKDDIQKSGAGGGETSSRQPAMLRYRTSMPGLRDWSFS
jgi:hypothetical protein